MWTGTEMIVWGGVVDPDSPTDTGARYNPDLDAWMPISRSNAPSPYSGHTALWAGTEMYVLDRSEVISRYNPAGDAWTRVTNSVVFGCFPAFWTGTEIIGWCGGAGLAGQRFDPTSNTVNRIAALGAPAQRNTYVAVWTDAEMIIWGGSLETGAGYRDTNTGARYSPATNKWTSTSMLDAPPPVQRGVAAVWTGAEMIVWGGYLQDEERYSKTPYHYKPANARRMHLYLKP